MRCSNLLLVSTGKAFVEWKRGPQPQAAGDVASSEALRGVIEELMNAVSYLNYVTARISPCLLMYVVVTSYIFPN